MSCDHLVSKGNSGSRFTLPGEDFRFFLKELLKFVKFRLLPPLLTNSVYIRLKKSIPGLSFTKSQNVRCPETTSMN